MEELTRILPLCLEKGPSWVQVRGLQCLTLNFSFVVSFDISSVLISSWIKKPYLLNCFSGICTMESTLMIFRCLQKKTTFVQFFLWNRNFGFYIRKLFLLKLFPKNPSQVATFVSSFVFVYILKTSFKSFIYFILLISLNLIVVHRQSYPSRQSH